MDDKWETFLTDFPKRTESIYLFCYRNGLALWCTTQAGIHISGRDQINNVVDPIRVLIQQTRATL